MARRTFSIYESSLSFYLFLFRDTPNTACKIKYRAYFTFLRFFYIEKFTDKARKRHVTLHVNSQVVQFDFGFGPHSVLLNY